MTFCAELIGEEGWLWYQQWQLSLIISVQPMIAPTGQVFTLKRLYENEINKSI